MSYRAKHSLSNIAKNDDTHDVRISPESLLYTDLLLLLLLAAAAIVFLFILHLISPVVDIVLSTDLAWSWVAMNQMLSAKFRQII